MNWNMPYGAMRPPRRSDRNYASPAGNAMSSPGDIKAFTPPNNNAPSPSNAPSPLSKALAIKRSVDRAHMFVEGRFDDLMRSMNREEGMYVKMSKMEYNFF